VVVLTYFVMCVCGGGGWGFENRVCVLVICVLVFPVFYCVYCFIVLFRLCIFILICFVWTGVRTAVLSGSCLYCCKDCCTEWQLSVLL
jgi:hypothetical protein